MGVVLTLGDVSKPTRVVARLLFIWLPDNTQVSCRGH